MAVAVNVWPDDYIRATLVGSQYGRSHDFNDCRNELGTGMFFRPVTHRKPKGRPVKNHKYFPAPPEADVNQHKNQLARANERPDISARNHVFFPIISPLTAAIFRCVKTFPEDLGRASTDWPSLNRSARQQRQMNRWANTSNKMLTSLFLPFTWDGPREMRAFSLQAVGRTGLCVYTSKSRQAVTSV